MTPVKKFITLFAVCAVAFASWSCNSCSSIGNNTASGNKKPPRHKVQVKIVSPKNNERAVLGATLHLSLKAAADLQIDSIRWFANGKHITTSPTVEDIAWNTADETTGTHRIEAVAHYTGGERDIVSVSVLLLAPQPPKRYTYRIIKTYPHDAGAYTQGLLFDGGYLYESTGLRGESTVRKVVPTTGEVVQSLKMANDMFGEGLALVDDRLVQITWQNRTAFVYKKDDFSLLQKFSYPMPEGWGLTYDGEHLIMTDGSAWLYFMDKEYFTEVSRMEVCNHTGTATLLNELEYINGEIWANVYQRDEILRINPHTGTVTGIIDMKGLLHAADINMGTDVLNGIACDKATGKIYVTGKKWPKLFEIEIVNK
ncbi:MAG: glutaminyl-peptide cyclotransferase [Bacteroidales bacterium]|jgi:glutamine cyclotransferase|nr:glutaminyl-peptide cyclotransferase [Bacteroidales bacterium]